MTTSWEEAQKRLLIVEDTLQTKERITGGLGARGTGRQLHQRISPTPDFGDESGNLNLSQTSTSYILLNPPRLCAVGSGLYAARTGECDWYFRSTFHGVTIAAQISIWQWPCHAQRTQFQYKTSSRT